MSEEAKREYVELTAEMLDEVTGGSIYYFSDGSNVDGVAKYKIEGIMSNGKSGTFYCDDLYAAVDLARRLGISTDLIQLPQCPYCGSENIEYIPQAHMTFCNDCEREF